MCVDDDDDDDDDDYCYAVASSEVRALYPNKFIQYDEQRIYILNTLFNLPGLVHLHFLHIDIYTRLLLPYY